MKDTTKTETQHLIWAITADFVAVMILTFGLWGIEIWQDWLLVPINALPTSFWILYAMMCISWLVLPVLFVLLPGSVEGNAQNDGAPAKHSASLLSWLLVLISFVFFLSLLVQGVTWDGGELLYISLGVLFLLQLMLYFGIPFLAKRKNTKA
jgi:hypothetical protein